MSRSIREYNRPATAPGGPTLRELAVQALSSVEHGYDLLAPKFDRTPYRTPDWLLDETVRAAAEFGPYDTGLDLCCGTGAGVGVLQRLCRERAVGVDRSAGMLAVAAERFAGLPDATPRTAWVRADALALPFRSEFDLVVSFGAFGHFLPREWPLLFGQVRAALRPGGRFVFLLPAPAGPDSRRYWFELGFDTVMRVRNLVWRPRFVMYYRPFQPGAVRRELARAGFTVELHDLPRLGLRADGAPQWRLVVARV